MRTTVSLPPAAHRRVLDIARERGVSLSSVIAELTLRGLAELDQPLEVSIDADSGYPVVSLGRRVTSDDVAAALADE